jgi:hypothetical protein
MLSRMVDHFPLPVVPRFPGIVPATGQSPQSDWLDFRRDEMVLPAPNHALPLILAKNEGFWAARQNVGLPRQQAVIVAL